MPKGLRIGASVLNLKIVVLNSVPHFNFFSLFPLRKREKEGKKFCTWFNLSELWLLFATTTNCCCCCCCCCCCEALLTWLCLLLERRGENIWIAVKIQSRHFLDTNQGFLSKLFMAGWLVNMKPTKQWSWFVTKPVDFGFKKRDMCSIRTINMGPVCLCTSYMKTQDTLSCLK